MLREYWSLIKVQKSYKEWNTCNSGFEKYLEEVRLDILGKWKG